MAEPQVWRNCLFATSFERSWLVAATNRTLTRMVWLPPKGV